MFQRRSRKFRRRPNGRNHSSRFNDGKNRIRPIFFSSDKPRNNFGSGQNAEKLYEKYSALAKEALTSGDKTLSENYLQHADHFMRLVAEKKNSQNTRQTSNETNQNTNQTSNENNLAKNSQENTVDNKLEENNNTEKK